MSLFHSLLKVGQSLGVLENPAGVPATFPSDNIPSCYTQKKKRERKSYGSGSLTCRRRSMAIYSLHLRHGKNETYKHRSLRTITTINKEQG